MLSALAKSRESRDDQDFQDNQDDEEARHGLPGSLGRPERDAFPRKSQSTTETTETRSAGHGRMIAKRGTSCHSSTPRLQIIEEWTGVSVPRRLYEAVSDFPVVLSERMDYPTENFSPNIFGGS